MSKYKLIALDMDGTITQHKTPLEPANKAALDALGRKYRLLMVGAGQCQRIFKQMGQYPIDIVGNYGMQACEYNHETRSLTVIRDETLPCDRDETERRVTMLREKYGFTDQFYFSKRFKKHFGVSPREYRRKMLINKKD